ncbi:hypothetical protein DKX38_029770 [Salix brachista]|uniref:C-JID domain-containing protein n=1 Tax=Salix brachista TaxID=2182728 RepID=A0A5N5J1K4_9ROSI|nr:hypothetical protein DKX38_029770 [Salix brachista]
MGNGWYRTLRLDLPRFDGDDPSEWILKSDVSKAVEVGNKNNLTRAVKTYADSVVHQAGQAVAEGAKILQDCIGNRSYKSAKPTAKRLKEVAISCRGKERVLLLSRWVKKNSSSNKNTGNVVEKKEGGENKKGGDEVEKKQENSPVPVVLKVEMHCDGCVSTILKFVRSFEGVEAEATSNKLTNSANCFKLDKKAQIAAMHLKIQSGEKIKHDRIQMVLPGSEIPEWFGDKGIGSSLTIQLPSNSHQLKGIAFCLVFLLPLPSHDMPSNGFDFPRTFLECHVENPLLKYSGKEVTFKFYNRMSNGKSHVIRKPCKLKSCGVVIDFLVLSREAFALVTRTCQMKLWALLLCSTEIGGQRGWLRNADVCWQQRILALVCGRVRFCS